MENKKRTTTEEVVVGLIKNRHQMPVNQYIFDEIKNVLDFSSQEKTVMNFLKKVVGIKTTNNISINQCDYTDCLCYKGEKNLVVYITGLTCVTATLIRCCMLNGVNLTLMHFDSASENYIPQIIL